MNPLQRNQLTVAYLQTAYSLVLPDRTVWINPLDENSELRKFLTTHQISRWAVITPWNPRSLPLSAEENQVRLVRFEEEELKKTLGLTAGKDYWLSHSQPAQEPDLSETGFFISGLYTWEAVRIGHRWEQNAIVWGGADAEAEIIWCDHESQIALLREG